MGGDILKSNNVVVYSNVLNEVTYFDFSATDMDLFMSLCVLARDQNTQIIEIEFSELRKLAHFRNCTTEEFYKQLKALSKKIFAMTLAYGTEEEDVAFVLFPTYRVNKKEKILKIAVNEEFKYVLNQLNASFTMFDLEVFTSIKGKYAKTLYRNLAQYRHKDGSGWWHVDIENFKKLFDVPKSYKSKYMLEKVVNPAMQEIQHLYGTLVCEPQYAKKRGKPLSGFKFEFTKAVKKPKVEENVPTALPEQAKQANQAKMEQQAKRQNRFNDFPQRDYTKQDFFDIERKLLEKSYRGNRKNSEIIEADNPNKK